MYFPRLYPDELLYSAIARCRIHLGLNSHKSLLRLLFSDTKVAASTDLPTHLGALAANVQDSLPMDVAQLVRDHTLFPLYAPFIPQKRKQRLLASMIARAGPPALGLAGVTTSLVKWPTWLRYCPSCLADMAITMGECCWRRQWQAKGADACPQHRCMLLSSTVPFRRQARHEFIPASPATCPLHEASVPAPESAILLVNGVMQALALPDGPSPAYRQWTHFYHEIASENEARRGSQVRIPVLWEILLATHPLEWLKSIGLCADLAIPHWFSAIFRKHRKAFSYLQHLIVWSALRPGQTVEVVMKEVLNLPLRAVFAGAKLIRGKQPQQQIDRYRTEWLRLLAEAEGRGAQRAREMGGKAVYAWLYRHDKEWLLATNAHNDLKQGNNSKVDWTERDRRLVQRLIQIERSQAGDLTTPRQSRQWFLGQLPHSSSVRHHLEKLPLCANFLEQHSESIGEYQVRRLKRQMAADWQEGLCRNLWDLRRLCGLQKGRTTAQARQFLQELEESGCQQSISGKYHKAQA